MNDYEITPRNDAAFKLIFTRPGHERILIHFLNCAIKSDSPITSVELLNTEMSMSHVADKTSRLDIRATTQNGTKIDVEMQVGRANNMIARSLHYWCLLYEKDFKEGDDYDRLTRSVCINILNFNLFNDENFWHVGRLVDELHHVRMSDLIEIQFLELNKLKKFDEDSPITYWIEFFKDPYSDASQKLYTLVPELNEAKNVFEMVKADPQTRELIQERVNSNRDYISRINYAMNEARTEEHAKAEEEKRQAAKKLLTMGLSEEQISAAIGLNIEEIMSLKNDN